MTVNGVSVSALGRALKRIALSGLVTIVVLTATGIPANAAISYYVGYRCRGELGSNHPAACVWLNVDHTNNRMRAYAQATDNSYNQTYIAVRYLSIQRYTGTGWANVPGSSNNDLDGWHEGADDAIGPLWDCLGPGTYRAAVQFGTYSALGENAWNMAGGNYTYGQVYNC
jgi:hypothetical protein